jgi:hypothetical protein
MAEYRITSWREIPSMVTARDAAGATAKVQLADRFQEAIDELAMRTGAAGTDEYLAGWAQGEWQTRDGDPADVARAVADELERRHDDAGLAARVTGGDR